MRKFSIVYGSTVINVETGNHYRLVFPDGRWLLMEKYPDDTQTTPVENENISYSNAFVWEVEDKSAGAEWINHEQLQLIGELVRKKDQQLENE